MKTPKSPHISNYVHNIGMKKTLRIRCQVLNFKRMKNNMDLMRWLKAFLWSTVSIRFNNQNIKSSHPQEIRLIK